MRGGSETDPNLSGSMTPMAFYDYVCCECEEPFEKMLPMSQSDVSQSCPHCGYAITKKVVTAPHVIFKGDDWASKNGRVQRQMSEKNAKLGKKQDERKREGPSISLVPNVDGEKVGSWSDAQKLAKSKGKRTESYEPLVRKEQAPK